MQGGSGAWSPYLVGALIGLLSMATFYFSNKPLSVSTAYARLAGMVGNLFSKGHTENLKFYQDKKPKVEWQVMLVVGMALGAFIAAATGGELAAAVLASIRGSTFPAQPFPEPDDVDRWLDMSELISQAGVELLEWFVIDPTGVWCPRDLLGEAPRW